MQSERNISFDNIIDPTGTELETIILASIHTLKRGNKKCGTDEAFQPDTSDTSATPTTRMRHDCNTSNTRATRVQYEWKNLILTMAEVEAYFHTPIFTIWQVKDYKERNNFILGTTFSKCIFPMPNSFEKCTTESYIKKLYTRL